jgi:glycosyltransferase involved in cell wall biosynthesis
VVTVITCTFNNERTIKRTIDSIQSQDFSNWELIIIDADSSDLTLKYISDFMATDNRIKLISLEYQSPWEESTLFGLEAAKGQYSFILDADDFVKSNYISSLLNCFVDKELICATGNLMLITKDQLAFLDNPSNYKNFKFTAWTPKWIRISGALLTPESFGLVNCVYGLWQTSCLMQIRNLDEFTKSVHQDQYFILNALKMGRIKYTNTTTHVRELTETPKTQTKKTLSLKELRFTFLFQLLKTIPPNKIYLTWIIKNISLASVVYILIVLIRNSISVPVYLNIFIYRVTINAIKKFIN